MSGVGFCCLFLILAAGIHLHRLAYLSLTYYICEMGTLRLCERGIPLNRHQKCDSSKHGVFLFVFIKNNILGEDNKSLLLYSTENSHLGPTSLGHLFL